ncbi:MAG: hypothetical protein FJY99_12020 [Candidatus Sericytochromatia bacterium]|nr:hypothetical protein [Candidatus Tanganyikabacteria bacterium]
MICIYHQHEPGTVQCQRCRIPLCSPCGQDSVCKACRAARDQALGQRAAGSRPARLVDSPRTRSVTRRLVTARAERLASAQGARRRSKGDTTLGWAVAALVAAFVLGRTWGGSQETPATDPPAPAPIATEVAAQREEASRVPDEPSPQARDVVRDAVYIPSASPEARIAPRGPARPAMTAERFEALIDARIAAAAQRAAAGRITVPTGDVLQIAPAAEPPAAAPTQAAEPAAGSVSLAWPTAGNTLRYTTYIKVRLDKPQAFRLLQVAVDGRAVVSETRLSAQMEVPLDTTGLEDGPHKIRLYAWTHGGRHQASEPVDVEITNTP